MYSLFNICPWSCPGSQPKRHSDSIKKTNKCTLEKLLQVIFDALMRRRGRRLSLLYWIDVLCRVVWSQQERNTSLSLCRNTARTDFHRPNASRWLCSLFESRILYSANRRWMFCVAFLLLLSWFSLSPSGVPALQNQTDCKKVSKVKRVSRFSAILRVMRRI